MKNNLFLALIYFALLLVGCSKDDNAPAPAPIQKEEPKKDDTPAPQVLTGVFKDAEVQGLTFETTTQNGITNEKGEFTYLENEDVTFKIGNVILGTVPGQDLVTPITIAQQADATATISSAVAMNIAALLQTLDMDQIHDNGIQIAAAAASNLGVSEIDFSAPVENTLAKVVVNISQNGGSDLNVVYPETAAMNMALSLGEEISLEPNYTVSHFMPFLKSFFESSYYSNMPPSAVHVNNFDVEGKLTSTDIVLRYSGRTIYSLVYDGHAENGLPNKGSLTYKYADLPMGFGASPPSNPITYGIEMSYDTENHVEVMSTLFEGSTIPNPISFGEYDNTNRPLAWSTGSATEDDNNTFGTSYTVSYENERLATEKLEYFSNYTDSASQSSTNSVGTNDYRYSYNAMGNYGEIVSMTTSMRTINSNGEETVYNSSATIDNDFVYTGDNKLQSRTRRSDRTDDGVSNSFTREFLFDGDEFLTVYTFTNEDGFSSESQLQQGVFSSSTSYQDDVLSREEEYLPDGSRIDTQYYYDANGYLLETHINESNANYLLTKSTIKDANDQIINVWYFNDAGYVTISEYYNEGVISYIDEYEYDSNNFVTRVVYKDAEGNILTIDNYLYENGVLSLIERTDVDGNLLSTFVYEYDANGLLSAYTGFNANGIIFFKFFYENNVAVRCEYYDEQGNLAEVVDHTSSGKRAILDKAQYDQGQKMPERDIQLSVKRPKNRTDVLSRQNNDLILQTQRISMAARERVR